MVNAIVGRDEADARFHFVRRVAGAEAGDFRVAGVGPQEADDHANRRRFSGAVRAQQSIHFAGRHGKRHAIDRHDFCAARVKLFRQFVDCYHLAAMLLD